MVIIWLFDSRNFLSVVAYDPVKDGNPKAQHRAVAEASLDPKAWLLLRSRLRVDIESVGTQLGVDVYLSEDVSADYSFRGLISRDDFKAYLALQVDDITYGAHFKEVVRSRSDQKTAGARYSAMLTIWSAMARLQPTAPYSGKFKFGWTAKDTKNSKAKGLEPWDRPRDGNGRFVKSASKLKAPAAFLADDYLDYEPWERPRDEKGRFVKTSLGGDWIGLVEMGRVLQELPLRLWRDSEIARLDPEARELYEDLVYDRREYDRFLPEEFAELADLTYAERSELDRASRLK